MRILIATELAEVAGGAEVYVSAVIVELLRRGHLVSLLTKRLARPGVRSVARETAIPQWYCEGREAAALNEVEAWRPDVCYLQSISTPEFEGQLADRFKIVLFAHNYFGACISGTKRRQFPALKVCKRTLGPVCLALYLPCGCGGKNPLTMLSLYREHSARQRLLKRFEAVAVASRYMYDEYRRHGVPESKLKLLPLFVAEQTPDSLAPIQRAMSNSLLYVGRLSELKGLDVLVEAVAILQSKTKKRYQLIVAGDGPYDKKLREICHKFNEVDVQIKGWVNAAQREALMREADILVVPSTWPEPFGLVGIEAGCVGLPAVAFAVGGIPDWLEPGKTGELASSDELSAQSFAEALDRALCDPVHWQTLRVGAWKMTQRFSIEAHMQLLEALLNNAAK